ncbi:MAG: hypothetical protein CMN76_16320 [Spirochaetaceae bacterium]|mgnify:FL=1|nr:hypothetical protein [Spirochaetaceae bacterium]
MVIGMIAGVAPMPEPVPRAILTFLTAGNLTGPPLMLLSMVAHFGYGTVWALIAGRLLTEFRTLQGLALGAFLWLLMQVLVLPGIGWGFFGIDITPAIAVATLVLHLIYGAVTGYLAGSWLETEGSSGVQRNSQQGRMAQSQN